MKYRNFRFVALVAALILVAVPAYAAKSIGVIAESHGETYRVKGGKERSLRSGKKIFLNDTLKTGEGAGLHIKFIDDTEIFISENAELIIDEYVYDDSPEQDSEASFNFTKGNFHYISGLIAKEKPEAVELHTMFGSIGIRGTKVWGGMLDKECKIYVEDGSIKVFNEFGSVHLGHGYGTTIVDGKAAPTEPVIWGDKIVDWIKSSVKF